MAAESLASQAKGKRSAMIRLQLEAVSLELFRELGFSEVTVDRIAAEAQTSSRTFYRYFPAKEDVLQVRIDQRSDAIRAALATRPSDEPPLQSLRLALDEMLGADDLELLRCWMDVIAATPTVLRGVLGGIQLKMQPMIAEFFALRLDQAQDGLVPTMLAAAVGGVIQTGHSQWYLWGGDLPTRVSQGISVLERGVGPDADIWSQPRRRK